MNEKWLFEQCEKIISFPQCVVITEISSQTFLTKISWNQRVTKVDFTKYLLCDPASCLEWIGSTRFSQKNYLYKVKIAPSLYTGSWFDEKYSSRSSHYFCQIIIFHKSYTENWFHEKFLKDLVLPKFVAMYENSQGDCCGEPLNLVSASPTWSWVSWCPPLTPPPTAGEAKRVGLE